jgi:hypothetical protein
VIGAVIIETEAQEMVMPIDDAEVVQPAVRP